MSVNINPTTSQEKVKNFLSQNLYRFSQQIAIANCNSNDVTEISYGKPCQNSACGMERS
jgi:hypothetical protein